MYLDPGLGSMIIQAALACFAVVGGFFVAFNKQIKLWFEQRKKKAVMDAEDEQK